MTKRDERAKKAITRSIENRSKAVIESESKTKTVIVNGKERTVQVYPVVLSPENKVIVPMKLASHVVEESLRRYHRMRTKVSDKKKY